MDKIICVGKNYSEHVKELGGTSLEKPVLFLKPPSVMREARSMGETVEASIPPECGLLHHECEIVLKLRKGGYRLSREEVSEHIGAVTLGLDMTLRERQQACKKTGNPWTTSKVFLDSAIVGPWMQIEEFPNFLSEPFRLSIDNVVRQETRGQEMIWSPVDCLSYISHEFPLKEGDLVFTGTPAGVGPIVSGNRAELVWGQLRFNVKWKAY